MERGGEGREGRQIQRSTLYVAHPLSQIAGYEFATKKKCTVCAYTHHQYYSMLTVFAYIHAYGLYVAFINILVM